MKLTTKNQVLKHFEKTALKEQIKKEWSGPSYPDRLQAWTNYISFIYIDGVISTDLMKKLNFVIPDQCNWRKAV